MRIKVYAPLFLLLALLIYVPWQQAEFLLWDDLLHLTANPYLNPVSFSHIVAIWIQSYKALYNPVLFSLWSVLVAVIQVFTPNWAEANFITPFLFLNVITHTLNAILIYILTTDLTKDRKVPLLTALIFLVHPLQVESVAWASDFKELSWVTFALAALLFYRQKRLGLTTLAFALSLLCKPTAAIVPILLLSVEPVAKSKRFWLSLAGLSIALLAFTKNLQPDSGIDLAPSILSRGLVALDAIGFYTTKMIWPFGLIPDYGRRPSLIGAQGISFYVCFGFLTLAVVLYLRNKKSAFFLAPLLPVLGLVPFSFQNYSTVADRYAYFSVFGFALLFTLFLSRFKSFGRVVALIAILFFATLSSLQVPIWRTNEVLFTHILRINPNSYMAELNLGVLEEHRDEPGQAIEHFEKSLALNPDYAEAVKNLGAMLINTDQAQNAVELFEPYVYKDPNRIEFRLGLGTAFLRLGKFKEATQELAMALRLNPNDALANEQYALALAQSGKTQEAIPYFEKAVLLSPQDSGFQFNLQHALESK